LLSCYNFVAAEEHTVIDLRKMRRMAGWTQARTSRASGVNRCKISQVESGEIELNPQEEAILRTVLVRALRGRADRINAVLISSGIDSSQSSD
jgi:transcriptional regulator with XRE-family HTH domain